MTPAARSRLVALAIVVAGYVVLHLAGMDAAALALLRSAPDLTSPAVVTPPPSPVADSDDGGPPP